MNESIELTEPQILAARDSALVQMKFAREYLLGLVESVPIEMWYQIPNGQVSCVAWQVGHLTVAQYGLMLFRQRGRSENDTQLMPGPFRKRFSKGTEPASLSPEMYSPEDLKSAMASVHEESMKVCSELLAATLWEPIDMPYAGYPRKSGALLFCPMHEMIHAGQIGSLRRSLGLAPLR